MRWHARFPQGSTRLCLASAILLPTAGLAQARFQVSARTERDGTNAPLISVAFTVPERFHLYRDRLHVEAEPPATLAPLPPPSSKQTKDPDSGETVYAYDRDVTFQYRLTGYAGTSAAVRVTYQGCSDTVCFLPATARFVLDAGAGLPIPPPAVPEQSVAGAAAPPADGQSLFRDFHMADSASGYLSADAFLTFLSGSPGAPAHNRLVRLYDRHGWWPWLAALLIVLGGLGLNLTPCVLPMIPVNVAILGAGVEAGSKRRGFMLGTTYGLAMAATYGALGLAVVLTGARFGALNATPLFNLLVAVLFLVLSLSMFGVFSLDLSRFQKSSAGGTGKHRFVTAFVMGAVAALLAGACVAPVIISVLLLSTGLVARHEYVGLVLPFLLGIGMGLPWPFLGAGLSFLPKPGRWMIRVKVAFGILILAAAAYYGYLAAELYRDRLPERRAAVEHALTADSGWLRSLPRALELAGREHRKVLIDFWASWCKSCLAMERTTFRNADVRKRLGDFVLVKVRAEDPNEPGTRALLDRFGIVGLPTYVILESASVQGEAR